MSTRCARGFHPGAAALIDLPWIIFFLAAVCLLHWILAAVALAGAAISIGLTFLNERATRQPMREVSQIQSGRNGLAESNLRHVEVLAALGMRRRMRERWEAVNATYLGANRRLAESISYYGGIGRVFRLFLQSALITVGALLVMSGQASGGVIFASSILCGRALAPVDQVIGGWRTFSAARDGWARLNALFVQVPETAPAGVDLPLPNRTLAVEQIHVAPPGTQRLTASGIDFKLAAGDALGIIGPSAAGKTTVARALAGVWKPLRGAIRLDGATLEQWDPERLGTALGYLPQTVELLEGTVGENIARFDPAASSEQIIAAARAAGMHDMIVALPQGYDTPAGTDGQALSAGQRQRIGLARALYGDPFLLVLDEPNSNLDAEGEAALEGAITGTRARGGIVIIIAHRPSALSRVSHVLFLRAGKQEAFGPRDEVLRAITRTSSAPAPIDIPPLSRCCPGLSHMPPLPFAVPSSGDPAAAADDPDLRVAHGIRTARHTLALVGLAAFVGLVLVPIGGAVVASGQVGVGIAGQTDRPSDRRGGRPHSRRQRRSCRARPVAGPARRQRVRRGKTSTPT
ncbi:type I secretion system permease/ATPase [Novosphingobium colocasiae]